MGLLCLSLVSGGCGGEDKSKGAGEDAGAENFEEGFPLASEARKAIVADIQSGGSTVEYAKCEYFAPELGGDPVFNCRIKVDGTWHGNIQVEGFPDGTVDWEDLSETGVDFAGGQLQAK